VNAPSIIFLLSHSSAGGVQEMWADLAEGFRTRGFDVRLMALYPYLEAAPTRAEHLPWTYVVARRPTNIGEKLGLFRSLVHLFKTEPSDLVFTAMPAANVLAPLAARMAGAATRIVVSHHSPVETYNPLLNAADSLVGSLKNIQTVVSVSNAVGASLAGKSRPYRAKRRTSHNALPARIEADLAIMAAKRNEQPKGRRVVAAGRLAPEKNYPALIRAAARMPDVAIQILGTGPHEEMLKALADELDVADRVRFLGHRPRKEAFELLAAGDVFVQPSLFEGHSVSLIEAAKLNLPLVVSNVPSQIEGITATDGTRCGIAVDAHDDAALADAIRCLLDDSVQLEHWAGRARHLAATHTHERMMAAYRELVD
jgi:glycosyltransferase involved in cell wall biosynthesis